MPRKLRAVVAGLTLAIALAAPTTSAYSPGAVNLAFILVASGLSQPVLVTHSGDGTGRLFIVQQGGRVRIVQNGALLGGSFIDLTNSVSKGSEQGLLGLAFHPQYETNRKFYVSFTLTNGDSAINEYRASPTNPNIVQSGSGRRILTVAQPAANHNGGHIAFGSDGYLYIGFGDGGGSGDPGNRAQNLNTLLGKMLRIDVNGTSAGKAYRIPSTNPYVGTTGLDEIWARGLRNPWRWSFDRLTGDLWIGDVGQGKWEEIDRSKRTSSGAGRAANYGWRVMEGRHCFSPSSGCSTAGKVLPIAEYSHSSGSAYRCSVTGGYVYRGSTYPDLVGVYLFADYCTGEIFAISSAATYPGTAVRERDTSMSISSFGEDEYRRLYVVDRGGGRVYRIVDV
jgi:glucose/arabinose dehydrogenase